MGLDVDDPRVDRLIADLVRMTGETEEAVVTRALEERLAQLRAKQAETKVAHTPQEGG